MLSRDEHDPSGMPVAKVVEEVFVNHGLVWHLHVGGQVIRTAAEHPFFVNGRGWVGCKELQIGDQLLCEDGTWVAVEDLLDTGESEALYNFRVADYHTYFVGCDEWGFSAWTHNECFYRAMSEVEYANVIASQRLSRRDQGSSELAITQNRAYAESLVDRRNGNRKYPRVVEIEMKEGTQVLLVSVAGLHNSIPETLFSDRPAWTAESPIMLKLERMGVISYLISNDVGLQIVNGQIVSIKGIR